jgi:hypothetical protein
MTKTAAAANSHAAGLARFVAFMFCMMEKEILQSSHKVQIFQIS